MTKRIWVPDFVRGIAIIMVVAFHLIFDLNYFYDFKISYTKGFWYYEGLLAAILFMSMVGFVTAIIFREKEFEKAVKISLKRGLKLLTIAMLITLISYLLFPSETVWFGILHLMAVSIILTIPLAKFKWLNVILGVSILCLGKFDFQLAHPLLIPLGFPPNNFSSLDYYPLIPWLGIILIGVGLGNLLYKKFVQLETPQFWQKGLIELGKNSLWIYLLHLPLIYGFLWLIFR